MLINYESVKFFLKFSSIFFVGVLKFNKSKENLCLVQFGLVSFNLVRFNLVWFDPVWFGLIWFDSLRFNLVQCG